MLSEWLVEVPVDLAEKWLLILCPEVCPSDSNEINMKCLCRVAGTS